MFCKNCGNQIDDNAAFCPVCGTALKEPASAPAAPTTANTTAPAAPSAASVIFQSIMSNLVRVFKEFFSCDVMKGLATAAKSTTHEWAVLLFAYVLIFSLSVPIVIKCALGSIAYFGSYIAAMAKFGPIFGISLLVALIANAAIFFGLFVQIKLIHKKNVSIISVLNAAEYAMLPITLACLINMLLALIWAPLAIMTFITAFIMQTILLYVGLQKLDKLEKSPFYTFTLVSFVCVCVVIGVAALLYNSCLSSILSGMTDSLLGGGLFSSLLS